MENILTDGHCLSPYTCKCCIVFKQFDGLNFDGLKCQNFPHQNFALYGNTVRVVNFAGLNFCSLGSSSCAYFYPVT